MSKSIWDSVVHVRCVPGLTDVRLTTDPDLSGVALGGHAGYSRTSERVEVKQRKINLLLIWILFLSGFPVTNLLIVRYLTYKVYEPSVFGFVLNSEGKIGTHLSL